MSRLQVRELNDRAANERAAAHEEHVRAMGELVEETKARLQQMELDYKTQLDKNVRATGLATAVASLLLARHTCRDRRRGDQRGRGRGRGRRMSVSNARVRAGVGSARPRGARGHCGARGGGVSRAHLRTRLGELAARRAVRAAAIAPPTGAASVRTSNKFSVICLNPD